MQTSWIPPIRANFIFNCFSQPLPQMSSLQTYWLSELICISETHMEDDSLQLFLILEYVEGLSLTELVEPRWDDCLLLCFMGRQFEKMWKEGVSEVNNLIPMPPIVPTLCCTKISIAKICSKTCYRASALDSVCVYYTILGSGLKVIMWIWEPTETFADSHLKEI